MTLEGSGKVVGSSKLEAAPSVTASAEALLTKVLYPRPKRKVVVLATAEVRQE